VLNAILYTSTCYTKRFEANILQHSLELKVQTFTTHLPTKPRQRQPRHTTIPRLKQKQNTQSNFMILQM